MYYLITIIRNFLFDKGFIHQVNYKENKGKKGNCFVLCVGNLRVGGTGKTPMIEYLIKNLSLSYNLSVLSLGYKRKTKGFLQLTQSSTSEEVGDEPKQMRDKFPLVNFFVCKDRNYAISKILSLYPNTNLILLDDCYQYRKTIATKTILLTEFARPFYKDFVIPYGRLREKRRESKRSDYIIITKCPNTINNEQKDEVKRHINLQPYQQLFFSKIIYKDVYLKDDIKQTIDLENKNIILVVGIDNPQPIIEYISKKNKILCVKQFNDHHLFTEQDINEIEQSFNKNSQQNPIILTTEKDAIRLYNIKIPLYVLPIENIIEDKNNDKEQFIKQIRDDIRRYFAFC
jgi:tetraacyldisaccharide 4'-kinase